MSVIGFWCLFLILSSALGDNQCSLLCSSKVCCSDANGKLLCCPSSGGVCCETGNSCCPRGTICNPDGSCTKTESGFFSFLNFLMSSPPLTQISTTDPPAAPVEKIEYNLNACSSSCGLQCCPHENGVCCDDGKHCCPHGFLCDASTKSCRFSTEKLSSTNTSNNRTCLLEDSHCSSTDTCCLLSDGTKGCCPHENAECCADGYHCCPKGTKCNAEFDGCIPAFGAWVNPFKPSNQVSNQKGVKCPDDKSLCRDDSTCCKAQGVDAEYDCCPLENAVCCKDGKHCCPHGTQCDLDSHTCHRESTNLVPVFVSEAGPAFGDSVKERIMCDRKKYCEGPHATCCRMPDNSWGCCPFSKAICCSDRMHCCPNGYSCDPSGRCIQTDYKDVPHQLAWGLKSPSINTFDTGNNVCKDKLTTCEDNMTCCQTGDTYGCCDMPNAVCCLDGIHCCPYGFKCDEGLGACVRSDAESSDVSNLSSISNVKPLSCRPDSTPCFANREIGCCPIKNAVCCLDGIHCCPEGFICNGTGQCVQEHTDRVLATAPRIIFGS